MNQAANTDTSPSTTHCINHNIKSKKQPFLANESKSCVRTKQATKHPRNRLRVDDPQ